MALNPHLRRVLNLLGIARPRPTTRLGRLARAWERTFTVLLVLYMVLHWNPSILLAHTVTASGVTLHAREPLPAEAVDRIREAAALVARSELAVPGRSEHIYICNDPWLFRLFGPASGGFAFSIPLTDHTFVRNANFAEDIARSDAPEFNRRSLSAVLAHEITHGLIRARIGLPRSLFLPDWIAEGYCDFVAGEGSFPEAEGALRFAEGRDHPSPSYRYFAARKVVADLLVRRRLSFDEVARRAGEHESFTVDARAALRSTRPAD